MSIESLAPPPGAATGSVTDTDVAAPDAVLRPVAIDELVAQTEELVAVWVDAFFASASATADGAALSMTDEGLLRVVAAVASLRRMVDAVSVRVAGEVAERSRAELGAEGVARRLGASTVAGLLGQRWGMSRSTASRFVEVAGAASGGRSLTGEVLPPRFEAFARAMAAGALGVEHAAVIAKVLAETGPVADPGQLAAAERVLVEETSALTVEETRSFARMVRDRLDQDGAEPREERQLRRRRCRLTMLSDGMMRLEAFLDPLSAGIVKTGIDTLIAHHIRAARFEGEPTGASRASTPVDHADPGDIDGHADISDADAGALSGVARGDAARMGEHRSLDQLRADALVDVFRHAASCTCPGDQPAITVIVRMTLDQLRGEAGTASIDGVDETITAARARELLGAAGIIPEVLGSRGETFDLGRTRRLFSAAQRLALAGRDGGCSFPRCRRPPAFTEAHHIRWWARDHGDTSLDNGTLLCSEHHHLVHRDGWHLELRGDRVWYVPPPHIDPARTPIPGGRPRPNLAQPPP
ncbi:HNH endonuclease signature motif containing protein [Compostimonas suwonensis]|uniref:Uncharacterized protein DUF222 n=1 Tax=Compostimonas suwonensis TaxID=1048394 RepID=A0A2M9BB85_9MICO|nr:HNH endonuclease signature motif containing protein [Compostimonas suwonensis]PJJ55199.1 uncharacterized protein DUF222 [Compostimonas suwonensis]